MARLHGPAWLHAGGHGDENLLAIRGDDPERRAGAAGPRHHDGKASGLLFPLHDLDTVAWLHAWLHRHKQLAGRSPHPELASGEAAAGDDDLHSALAARRPVPNYWRLLGSRRGHHHKPERLDVGWDSN